MRDQAQLGTQGKRIPRALETVGIDEFSNHLFGAGQRKQIERTRDAGVANRLGRRKERDSADGSRARTTTSHPRETNYLRPGNVP